MKSEADLKRLDRYLAQFAQESESTTVGTEEARGLFNASDRHSDGRRMRSWSARAAITRL